MPRLQLGHASRRSRVGPRGVARVAARLPGVLRAVALVLCVAGAGAAGQHVLPRQADDEEGIDIVVVLDLSGLDARRARWQLPPDLHSYAPPKQRGVRPTRLDTAKAVIRDFIARRKTDRIGVVVFGKSAYVLSPPTLDYHLLDALVVKMELDVIDGERHRDRRRGRRRRRAPPASHARSKAIILLTDGDSNAGQDRAGVRGPPGAAQWAPGSTRFKSATATRPTCKTASISSASRTTSRSASR